MKVQQVRAILMAAADLHRQSGNSSLADAYTELAELMKPYDKTTFVEFVDRVAMLRGVKQSLA